MANQSLIRDTQEMQADGKLSGPVVSFLRVGEALSRSSRPQRESQRPRKLAANEHLVSAADPFQAQAVRLAREHTGLVSHGPPGTGKSQTIANIIGDHWAREWRALLVCDKRTALDVVANRLQHLGLGDLCALVHDPQPDRRELYKGLRDQLDGLTEESLDPTGVAQLAKVNSELQELHDTLATYYRALDGSGPEQRGSFHDLVGRCAFRRNGPRVPVELDRFYSHLQFATRSLVLRKRRQEAWRCCYVRCRDRFCIATAAARPGCSGNDSQCRALAAQLLVLTEVPSACLAL